MEVRTMRKYNASYERIRKNMNVPGESGHPAELDANGPGTKNGKIIHTYLVNARVEPSLESAVVRPVRNTESFKILSKESGFYKVLLESDAKIAFISSDYVTVVKDGDPDA